MTGSVQISARVVETGKHKMMELGFDINCVLSGGRAFYTVWTEEAKIE